MGDFDDIISALSSIPGGVQRGTTKGLRRGGTIVLKRAKMKLGTYQSASGDYPAWVKLKPATVKRKHTSRSGSNRGSLTRAGRRYIRMHGSWGSGGNDDSPLVDTGHLKQAITMDDSELENKGVVYVGVAAGSGRQGRGGPADGAAAHEFGYAPKNIPARPYLRPALHESREEIKEAVAQALAEELRRNLR